MPFNSPRLIVGPTRSGKTTLMQTELRKLQKRAKRKGLKLFVIDTHNTNQKGWSL